VCTNRADDVVNTILVDVDNATTVTILRARADLAAQVRLTLDPEAFGLFAIEWVPRMMPRPPVRRLPRTPRRTLGEMEGPVRLLVRLDQSYNGPLE